MACPRCGGQDRTPVAPGLWRCTALLSRSSVAGLDPHGAPLFAHQSFECGTEYPEGPPPERGAATCGYCTTFAVGTCADCKAWVCGDHSAMPDGRRICLKCREALRYSQLFSIDDFLAAARAQAMPGVRTWQVATSRKEPRAVRSRGLNPHDHIAYTALRESRPVQGWVLAGQESAMLGADGAQHVLQTGASWRSSKQVSSTWYRVLSFDRRPIEAQSAIVRAVADREGIDLTALEARTPEQARQDWANQGEARKRADEDLLARAWSSWDAFVADGSFDRHGQDLFHLRSWQPMFGKTATEVSVTARAVRIGEIYTDFNADTDDHSGGPTQMCLTRDREWVTLDARRMRPGTDRFRFQEEVASRMLERLQALGWTRD